jgi:hypothetical protein
LTDQETTYRARVRRGYRETCRECGHGHRYWGVYIIGRNDTYTWLAAQGHSHMWASTMKLAYELLDEVRDLD